MSTLTSTEQEAVKLLAGSPLVAQARAAAEAERAEQRRTALARRADEMARLDAAVVKSDQVISACRAVFAQAEATLREARADLVAAEREGWQLGLSRERCENAAAAALAPLGGDDIRTTTDALLFERRRAQAAQTFHVATTRDHWGAQGPIVTEPAAGNAEHAARVAHIDLLVDELAALRLSDAAPTAIEQRCAEVRDWLDAQELPPSTEKARSAGREFVRRMWRGLGQW